MAVSKDTDASGKTKYHLTNPANQPIIRYFVLGLCLGCVLAERLYVSYSSSVHSRKLHGVRGEISAVRQTAVTFANKVEDELGIHHEYTGPPRSELEAKLREIAINKEVIAAVSNKNYLWGEPAMLKTFTDGFKRANIKNHLILALDEQTEAWCKEHDINVHRLKLQVSKAQANTGENHAVSAMKFGILQQFVDIGYNVLLSDVDIAILQNPFDFLYRDSDVEGMTDGFDEVTAYGAIQGFEDKAMGWARFAQMTQHFNLNSGLFYLRANPHTQELMRRLSDRLSKTKYWDQQAFNEEIFFLSHGAYKSPECTVRVMEIDKFMNSKRLFKILRHQPENMPKMPVTVHINYHPDKHERMLAVVKYWMEGDKHALDHFPDGSEPDGTS